MTFARYEVLVLLRFSRYGALPLGRIGERLMVRPTSMTSSMDRLEKTGFVERRPNPRGGRGTLVAITASGLAVVGVATNDRMDADFGLQFLGKTARGSVVNALRVLRVSAGDFGVAPDQAQET